MSAPTPGLVAEFELDDPATGDSVMFSEPVVWIDRGSEGDAAPFVAWVIHDGMPTRADSLSGFVGLGWRFPVVGALPGRGWTVRKGRTSTAIEAWLVRGDGSLAAAVVDGSVTRILDPLEVEVTFTGPAT